MKDILFPVQQKGKVGFINNKGKVVIDFEFKAVALFSEGLARVFYKNKVGCIDTKGNLVIPIQFEHMLQFSEGLAVIRVKDKEGYINKKGETVIPPAFYEAGSFQNGFARVHENMGNAGSFINKKGKTVLVNRVALTSQYNEDLINCQENAKWGYMNISGDIVIRPAFEYARPFFEGKAAVVPVPLKRKSKSENPYGFIDKQGKMIIPAKYNGADIRFSEDRCRVWKQQFGYIDATGDLVIPYQFKFAEHFSEGMAYYKLKENGKYGFIDKDGTVVVPPSFDGAESFKNGLAAVYLGKTFGKTLSGYINKKGDYVWEPSR